MLRVVGSVVCAGVLCWLGRGAQERFAVSQREGKRWISIMRVVGLVLAALGVAHLVSAWQLVLEIFHAFGLDMSLGMITIVIHIPGVPSALCSALMVLLSSVWMLWLGPRAISSEKLPSAAAGLLLLPWPVWMMIQRFLLDPVSVERLPTTMRILSAAALLVFEASLLHAVYIPTMPDGRGLYRAGMICFLFCTCLELPQILDEVLHGFADAVSIFTACALAALGLCGLYCAWLATVERTEQTESLQDEAAEPVM